VDIIKPDDKDFEYLKEHFQFHPLDFEDVVLPATRTKIDEYDSYHFVILLFPQIDRDTAEIIPTEVDFFLGKDFLITIHDGSMRTLNNLVHAVHQYDQQRLEHMSQGSGYLLFSILEVLFKRSAPLLDKINHQLSDASKNVFQVDTRNLEKLSALKKNIILYRRIVRMHRFVLTKLTRSKKDYLQFADSKTFFQDLIEYAENIWDILASDKESVESFEQTNQSLGTHRINDILKVLTVVSVVVTILTLVTDILIFFERTNIEQALGFSSEIQLLIFFTTILATITIITFGLFKKNKWL
jgi:magnesium transporter